MNRSLVAALSLSGAILVCGGLLASFVALRMSDYEPAVKYLLLGTGAFAAIAGVFLCLAACLVNHAK